LEVEPWQYILSLLYGHELADLRDQGCIAGGVEESSFPGQDIPDVLQLQLQLIARRAGDKNLR